MKKSAFHRIGDGWIEVRADGVTVWRERGDAIEPVVSVSAADLEAERVPPPSAPRQKMKGTQVGATFPASNR
jgi:hypothetical protein